MEVLAIVVFAVIVVGMVVFAHMKNQKAQKQRDAINANWKAQQEAEWAVSETNPDSPNFNKEKYEQFKKNVAVKP